MKYPSTQQTTLSFLRTTLTGIALGTFLLAGCGATDNEDVGEIGTGDVICAPADTLACYTGTAGTEGVGPCTSGIATCSEDGTTWGNCIGEVTPKPQECDSNVDNNCNGVVDDVIDIDGDGFTVCEGDCCETAADCAEPALVNPGAVEVTAEDGSESGDENCNGEVDEAAVLCDSALALDDGDALHAANALDICDTTYALVSAAYVRADGSAFGTSRQHGIQTAFGSSVVPRLGSSMLALSSGAARTPGQPGACTTESCDGSGEGSPPAGFPQDVPGCQGDLNINDDVALELTLKAPANAKGYSFDFKFYSFEYPEWVCTSFNDQFVALVEPAPEGSINGNIAFDTQTNPVSVNIAFFDVCEGCPLGTDDLLGTGFDTLDDAGATDWLRTQAPITGGSEFKISFMLWDTGDSLYDSTVLIDNFRWLADPVDVGTEVVD
ncbi:MAG: hypothetical protein GY811_00910 [Myxococcales bacterium]|nr:hypothetical protein [Myxococcales bacterium]